MKILGIETSTTITSVALSEEDKILGQITIKAATTHSKALLPMIDYLLDLINVKLNSIDVFAVSGGPGSFTGLRVGFSAAKGFAVAGNKPIAVVPTLEGIAYNICFESNAGKMICPLIDARCENVYTALFECQKDKSLSNIWKSQIINIKVLQHELKKIAIARNEKIILLGDAARIFCDCDKNDYLIIDCEAAKPSGVSICKLAMNKTYWCNASEAIPQYLKPPQIQHTKK